MIASAEKGKCVAVILVHTPLHDCISKGCDKLDIRAKDTFSTDL